MEEEEEEEEEERFGRMERRMRRILILIFSLIMLLLQGESLRLKPKATYILNWKTDIKTYFNSLLRIRAFFGVEFVSETSSLYLTPAQFVHKLLF